MTGQEAEMLPPVVVIIGPTGVGKSSLAFHLAHRFQADIVAADSRQIYRYMDIGTGKPGAHERAAVPHFMLDLIAPDETYSAHLYRKEALAVLRRIGRSGRLALVVGGTGFYIKSLLDGLSLPPVPPDPKLRRELYEDARSEGLIALHERLRRADPSSADRIHPNNLSRVIRALEIVNHLKGPVPSGGECHSVSALYLGLSLDTQLLRERIDRRIHEQIESGLVTEVSLLLNMGYSPETRSLQGLGYRQMVDHLKGKLSLDEAIAATQMATYQYARRQMTWFRADSRIHWLNVQGPVSDEASLLIAQFLSRASSPA